MIPLPPWVRPAIAATALLSVFAGGWQVRGWRCDAAIAERLESEAKARDAQAAKSNAAAAGFEQTRAQIDTDRRTGETEVRRIYETRTVPADCELAPDARRVLGQALERANAARVTGQPVPAAP